MFTGPLIVPTWKPELSSPKDIVDAIAVEWLCDEALTAAECVDVGSNSRSFSRNGLILPLQSGLPSFSSGFVLHLLLLINKHKMADPLGITAGAVGIIVPALHGTRLLLKDLQELKDAPKTVKRLNDDVHLVYAALELLKGVEDEDWKSLGQSVAEQSEATISSYMQACNFFRADLQKWTRHSEDGKLAWVDRANVGFFKKDQVKAMSEQLQSCKLAINLIVGIATL